MSLSNIPTLAKPVVYDDNCIFYTDKLIMDNETYFYDEIGFLFFEREVDKMNGYKLKDDIWFRWVMFHKGTDYIPIKGDFPIDGLVHMDLKKGLLPTFGGKFKRLMDLHNYVEKITFDNRLLLYLNTINKFGKVKLPNIVLHNNGDCYDEKGRFQGNICKMNQEGKLIWGESYGTYKYKINEPYHFGFFKGTKFFGIVKDEFKFKNINNKDVFDLLILRLIKDGKII